MKRGRTHDDLAVGHVDAACNNRLTGHSPLSLVAWQARELYVAFCRQTSGGPSKDLSDADCLRVRCFPGVAWDTILVETVKLALARGKIEEFAKLFV